MKWLKWLGGVVTVLVVVALLAAGGGLYYFKGYLPNVVAPQSFPQIDGQLRAAGLSASVDVYRDHMGIPHIYASTTHDLFFAEGYVHAQERFWQMDTWRHIGSGRVSEMFGKSQVATDTFLRTLGWRQTAEAEWNRLGPDSRAILQAYTDGVNAYLADHHGTALSLEYAVLQLLSPNYTIEPWTPVNSLTWGKAMAWDLRGNMDEEIERAVLLKTLSAAQVAELFPPYPTDHPVIVNQIGGTLVSTTAAAAAPAVWDAAPLALPDALAAATEHNVRLMDAALGAWGDGIGSNSWVVSGKLTAMGKPLLANDPHLGIQMPSIWY